jgi:hypothetical protein
LARKVKEPIVWIINSQLWPRAYLRAELMERGLDAVGFPEMAPALEALQSPHRPKPRIVVLELRELPIRRDELETLAQAGIPTIVLGGVAELNQNILNDFEWAAVIRRPFTIGAVADEVERVAGRRPLFH